MGVKKQKGYRNGRGNMSRLDLGEIRKCRGEK